MRTLLRGGLVIDTEPEVVARRDDRRTDRGRADRGRRAGADRGRRGGRCRGDRRDRADRAAGIRGHPPASVADGVARGVASTGTSGSISSACSAVRRCTSGPRMLLQAISWVRSRCLNGGVTTVQDYSHVQTSDAHADAALDALQDSGIRAVFGYGPSPLSGAAVSPDGMRRIMDRASERIGLAVASIGPSYRAVRDRPGRLGAGRLARGAGRGPHQQQFARGRPDHPAA